MKFYAEMTDLFGGEFNYSWIRRFKVEAKSPRGVMRKIGTGYKIEADYGDEVVYHSKSDLVGVLIRPWDEYDENQMMYFNVISL
jgi:hypothetical protein